MYNLKIINITIIIIICNPCIYKYNDKFEFKIPKSVYLGFQLIFNKKIKFKIGKKSGINPCYPKFN